MTLDYKEPEFKVVLTSAQDVLTASADPLYTPGNFETDPELLI